MPGKKNKHPDHPKRFVDEQKEKRIHEHLTIPGDIISEEDIRNVRTDIIVEISIQIIAKEKNKDLRKKKEK